MLSEGTPTPLQLAFALAICRTKPAKTSVKDYIHSLRSHVKADLREGGDTTRRRVNGASYWKEQYERVQAGQDDLQAAMVMLEQENAALNAQIKNEETEVPKVKSKKSKAKSISKRNLSRDNSVARPYKQLKASQNEQYSTFDDKIEMLLSDVMAISEPGRGTGLVHDIYSLNTLCKMSSSDSGAFTYHLTNAASNLLIIIQETCNRAAKTSTSPSDQASPCQNNQLLQSTLHTSNKNELKSVLRVCERSFRILLLGINKLASVKDADSAKATGSVTYAFTVLFRGMLECIYEASLLTAKSNTAELQEVGKPGNRKPGTPSVGEAEAKALPTALAGLMIACLSALDGNNAAHRSIFEGAVFMLFNGLGKCVRRLVFWQEKLSDDIVQPQDPAELSENKVGKDLGIEESALRIEAPYLIVLLQSVMNLAPAHSSSALHKTKTRPKTTSNAATSSSTRKSNSGRQGCGLTLLAKERLQWTLVNAIFENNDHDEFFDCLKMPAQPIPSPKVPQLTHEETPDWFIAELWRLLGWDILARENDW